MTQGTKVMLLDLSRKKLILLFVFLRGRLPVTSSSSIRPSLSFSIQRPKQAGAGGGWFIWSCLPWGIRATAGSMGQQMAA
jgi:hypothetical protein